MKLNTNIFDHLKVVAHSATHPKVWISAAIVHRNKIISVGVNQMKSHPFQKKFGRNSDAIYFHAETSAIYIADKKLGFTNFENSSLYVYRWKYDSSEKTKFVSGLALPCEGCFKCIREYGIKNIIYSQDYVENTKENFGVIIL